MYAYKFDTPKFTAGMLISGLALFIALPFANLYLLLATWRARFCYGAAR